MSTPYNTTQTQGPRRIMVLLFAVLAAAFIISGAGAFLLVYGLSANVEAGVGALLLVWGVLAAVLVAGADVL